MDATKSRLPKNFFEPAIMTKLLPDGTVLHDTPDVLVELTPVVSAAMPGMKSLNCQVRVYSHFWRRAWEAVADVGGRRLEG